VYSSSRYGVIVTVPIRLVENVCFVGLGTLSARLPLLTTLVLRISTAAPLSEITAVVPALRGTAEPLLLLMARVRTSPRVRPLVVTITTRVRMRQYLVIAGEQTQENLRKIHFSGFFRYSGLGIRVVPTNKFDKSSGFYSKARIFYTRFLHIRAQSIIVVHT